MPPPPPHPPSPPLPHRTAACPGPPALTPAARLQGPLGGGAAASHSRAVPAAPAAPAGAQGDQPSLRYAVGLVLAMIRDAMQRHAGLSSLFSLDISGLFFVVREGQDRMRQQQLSQLNTMLTHLPHAPAAAQPGSPGAAQPARHASSHQPDDGATAAAAAAAAAAAQPPPPPGATRSHPAAAAAAAAAGPSPAPRPAAAAAEPLPQEGTRIKVAAGASVLPAPVLGRGLPARAVRRVRRGAGLGCQPPPPPRAAASPPPAGAHPRRSRRAHTGPAVVGALVACVIRLRHGGGPPAVGGGRRRRLPAPRRPGASRTWACLCAGAGGAAWLRQPSLNPLPPPATLRPALPRCRRSARRCACSRACTSSTPSRASRTRPTPTPCRRSPR
jgi:hypothetical protein